jgi:hypothetical protein
MTDSCNSNDDSEATAAGTTLPSVDLDNLIHETAKVIFYIDRLRDAQLTACCNLLLGRNIVIIDNEVLK